MRLHPTRGNLFGAVDAERRRALAGAAHLGLAVAGLGWPARLLATVTDDGDLKTATVRQTVSPGRTLPMYLAVRARAHGRHAAVLAVHDGPVLGAAGRDDAARLARLGYVGCAPDFPSRIAVPGSDEAGFEQSVADALGAVQWLGRNPPGERVLTGKVAALGVGWGAALVERLVSTAGPSLAAAVILSSSYAPSVSDLAGTPLLRLDGEAGDSWTRIAAFLQDHLR